DPFPDQGRVLPWSTGAAVFFNYRDLQLTNNSLRTYQIRIYLDETYLNCELRVDVTPPLSYHISQQQHRFLRYENDYYRANE
ncbi:MAG: vancomycin resistance protein, partial [Prochlorococcus sp.]